MKKINLFCSLSLVLLVNFATGQRFSSIELLATTAYKNVQGKEARIVTAVFHGGKCYDQATVYVSINEYKDSLNIPLSREGLQSIEIPLPGPDITKETQVFARVKVGDRVYTARCLVLPARKWTVYILPHSHVDIGYTNVQEKVLKLHMDNIDESISLAEKTKDYPAGSRYKWNTEAIWVVENYLSRANAEKKNRFWNAVKQGWIGLDAAYGNINTSATDSRQLMQMFYEGKKTGADNGVNIETMFQGDVPGSSLGLSSQVAQTGIRYFLSGPNASDRIGYLAQWQDKPFYWQSPSAKERLLFWQCQPYSIGYKLKGSKIPNFFSVEDPKPYYTGDPSRYFLNPELFTYLNNLEKTGFPYDMTILTWALSDNAPIDPELPEAVKQWNENYSSPKLVICTTGEFFKAFESKYKDKIPVFTGDYTEYWTDGLGSAAKETAITRSGSQTLQQADAVMAIRKVKNYPAAAVNDTWRNLLLFSEHTWGAYNSVEQPEDPKVKSQWSVKQSFAVEGGRKADSILHEALEGNTAQTNKITVYNTNSWSRTDLVLVPAQLSKTGDVVKTDKGKVIVSQRLSTGELAFIAEDVPALGAKQYQVSQGKTFTDGKMKNPGINTLDNGIYSIQLNPLTGNVTRITKKGIDQNIADSLFNRYVYLPGDSVEKLQSTANAIVKQGENGPLITSLISESSAPGCKSLSREIRLIKGIDRVEIINTVNKGAVLKKESVLFQFPFSVPGGQVRYSIPWGSVQLEADQLPYSNRNWYTIQRWLDISNERYGVTWSSPDAPLVTVGDISIANLLGGLHFSPLWKKFSDQSSLIFSWVMNNLWHTNFPAKQEGTVKFRYYFTAHNKYDDFTAEKTGFENTWPLLAAPSDGPPPTSLLSVTGNNVYTEGIKPSMDGKGFIIYIVNSNAAESEVSISSKTADKLQLWKTNLLEEKKEPLNNSFTLPGKGILMILVELK